MTKTILFISDNKIFGMGGGSIENYKHFDALQNYCSSHSYKLQVLSNDDYFAKKISIFCKKNRFIDCLSRILGHSSFLFLVLLRNKKKLLNLSPDVVYLGRSRLGFFAKFFKKNNPQCIVITNVDNVEYDYVDSYFSETKGCIGTIEKYIEKMVVKRDEEDSVKYSDKLIFLTKRNYKRISELYNYNDTNAEIVPICMEKEKDLKGDFTGTKSVIFIGSLDYAPNQRAAMELLSLWREKYLEKEYNLIIGGRNPDKNVIEMVRSIKNAKLFENFERIEDIVPRGSLMVSAIDSGAGMKVKVAEALSVGIAVLGSKETFVGYEDYLNLNQCSGLFSADKESFEIIIEEFLSKSEKEIERIEQENKKLFRKFFSFDVSRKKISVLLDAIIA